MLKMDAIDVESSSFSDDDCSKHTTSPKSNDKLPPLQFNSKLEDNSSRGFINMLINKYVVEKVAYSSDSDEDSYIQGADCRKKKACDDFSDSDGSVADKSTDNEDIDQPKSTEDYNFAAVSTLDYNTYSETNEEEDEQDEWVVQILNKRKRRILWPRKKRTLKRIKKKHDGPLKASSSSHKRHCLSDSDTE
jgi:hypothetical protein